VTQSNTLQASENRIALQHPSSRRLPHTLPIGSLASLLPGVVACALVCLAKREYPRLLAFLELLARVSRLTRAAWAWPSIHARAPSAGPGLGSVSRLTRLAPTTASSLLLPAVALVPGAVPAPAGTASDRSVLPAAAMPLLMNCLPQPDSAPTSAVPALAAADTPSATLRDSVISDALSVLASIAAGRTTAPAPSAPATQLADAEAPLTAAEPLAVWERTAADSSPPHPAPDGTGMAPSAVPASEERPLATLLFEHVSQAQRARPASGAGDALRVESLSRDSPRKPPSAGSHAAPRSSALTAPVVASPLAAPPVLAGNEEQEDAGDEAQAPATCADADAAEDQDLTHGQSLRSAGAADAPAGSTPLPDASPPPPPLAVAAPLAPELIPPPAPPASPSPQQAPVSSPTQLPPSGPVSTRRALCAAILGHVFCRKREPLSSLPLSMNDCAATPSYGTHAIAHPATDSTPTGSPPAPLVD